MRMRALVGALAIVFSAVTAETRGAPGDRSVVRVGPERAVGGVTIEQRLARQAQLHELLMSELPTGFEEAPIQVNLDPDDRNLLAEPPQHGNAPLRIGVVKAVAGVEVVRGQAFKRGVTEETEDGGFVWAANVRSPEAQAIRVHFRNFSLPDNAELYFFNLEGQVDGPYTGKGRNGDGDFWTRSVNSDSAVIMIRFIGEATPTDRRQISFVVSDVGHINGRPPSRQERSHDSWPCYDNAPCLIDANCGNAGPAEAAKDAVAKMEWVAGCCINTCTGGLLADTDAGSQVPLFLTANHCLKSSSSNMEFWFNYTTDSCNGTCPDSLIQGGTPPPSDVVGFTVLASGRSGDYTLGQLNQSPPAGAVFLGWTNTPIANTNGAGLYRISNANWGPQVYSEHEVDTGTATCRGWPRGERIYSADIQGSTMGGSSGSPVVNSAGEVVGQLSGCCGYNCGNECDAASNSTVDGALAFYYNNVSQFLDPVGCTPSPENCTNGTDDDCDGDVDCADADCSADPACTCNPVPEVCDNGLDDDCDGDVDCNDADCSGDPACACLPLGSSCTVNSDCCSNKCKGPAGGKTCK